MPSRQILTDAGVNIASEVQSGGEGVGAEQDALAAQRFQADGVDLVIPIVGSSSIINFTAAAAEQGYNPAYIDTDWASHLADVATAAYAPGQYTDVPALASVRAGDLSVGLSPEAEECLADYEAFSGKTIPRTAPEQSGEYTNILITCDLANLMVEALRIATDGERRAPTHPGAIPGGDRADHRLPRRLLGDGQLLGRRSQRRRRRHARCAGTPTARAGSRTESGPRCPCDVSLKRRRDGSRSTARTFPAR